MLDSRTIHIINPEATSEQLEFQRIQRAKDYVDRYFGDDETAKSDEVTELVVLDTPLSELPEEELFIADAPISTFKVAVDKRRRTWLVRDRTRTIKETTESILQTSLCYDLARAVNVLMVETRLINIHGRPHLATRFLPNAVDRRINKFPAAFRYLVGEDLAAAWPFNFFCSAIGDLQFVVTPRAHAVLLDYNPHLFVPNHFIQLKEGEEQEPNKKKDPDVGEYIERRDDFNDYVQGKGIMTHYARQRLCRTVDAIANLSDEVLRTLIAKNLPRTMERSYTIIPNYRQAVLEGLQWQRDHVREVFHDFIEQGDEW